MNRLGRLYLPAILVILAVMPMASAGMYISCWCIYEFGTSSPVSLLGILMFGLSVYGTYLMIRLGFQLVMDKYISNKWRMLNDEYI